MYTSFYRPPPTQPIYLIHPGPSLDPTYPWPYPLLRFHPWMGVHLRPSHTLVYPSYQCHLTTNFTCPQTHAVSLAHSTHPAYQLVFPLPHTPSLSKLYWRIISNHHAHRRVHPFFPPSLWLVYPFYQSHASIVLLARNTAKTKQNWQIFEILLFIDYHDL